MQMLTLPAIICVPMPYKLRRQFHLSGKRLWSLQVCDLIPDIPAERCAFATTHTTQTYPAESDLQMIPALPDATAFRHFVNRFVSRRVKDSEPQPILHALLSAYEMPVLIFV